MSDTPPIRADVAEALKGQVRAADPAQTIWVEANAGTGKTKVLVDRISRLLMSGARPNRVLCLTFTKAAAAEMVNRLSDRLGGWAMANDETLSADLAKLLDRAPEATDLRRARTLFAAALDAPGGMHIRTIHSFCEALLGRFPLEAGVAPHAKVVDERGARDILVAARNAIFDQAADGDPALKAAFSAAATRMDETRFDALMGALMGSRGKLEAVLQKHGGPDGVMSKVRAALGLSDSDTPESIITDAAENAPLADLRRLADAFAQGAKTDQARAQKLYEWSALDAPSRTAAWHDYAGIFLTQKGRAVAESRTITKGAREADPGAEAIAFTERDRVADVAESLRNAQCAADTDSLIRIAAALLGGYENRKAAMAALDYDDLVLKARALLEAEGGASWVHFKLDGGLHHVLIDEAQDTGPDQWAVVMALVQEFYAGEGAVEPKSGPRTTFAVGDKKQSIYSFQGADPRVFDKVHTDLKMLADVAMTDLALNVSFRSTPSVLRAVDAVFAHPTEPDGLSDSAQAIEHLPFRTGQAGLVELWPTIDPDQRDPGNPWDAPVDQESETSPAVRLAQKIAATVAGWIKNRDRLESQARPITAGDVMVLVRKRGTLAEALVRALKDADVAVAGADRMVLTDQIAVQDLMALGDVLLLPQDDLSLATVLKGPFVGLDDDDLFALAYGRGEQTLWWSLRQSTAPKHQAAHTYLKDLQNRVDFETPYQTFAHVLNKGGRIALLERLGIDAADPVDAFLARALEYESDNPPTMQGFLQWIRTGAPPLKRDLEQAAGAVRVMTVHGSKGLQAPIVILPDTCSPPTAQGETRILWGATEDDPPVLWKPSTDDEPAAIKPLREAQETARDQEYRRLLYVAMTRARDRLYVCGYTGLRPKGPHEKSWYTMIAQAFAEDGVLGEAVIDIDVGDLGPDRGAGKRLGRRLMNPQSAPSETGGADALEANTPAPIPKWLRAPPPLEPTPSQPLQPTKPHDTDVRIAPPFGSDTGDRFRRGKLIHRLLQSLPDAPVADRTIIGARWLARPAHGLEANEQADVLAEVLAVLDDSDFAPVFGPGSKAEVPVVGLVQTESGPETISARIDRLLVTDTTVLVVDFKTNRPPPTDEASVDTAYIRQMALYRQLMQNAFPGHAVDCALIWTLDTRLMRISHARMDAAMPGRIT